MKNKNISFMTQAAMIAAIYVCSLMYSHHFHSERYRFVFQRP